MGRGRWGSCGDGMVGVGDNPGETEEFVDSDMNVALFFFLLFGVKESLDEVTIKDTLDGDNMYTCSQCGKKVRAEKR